MRYTIAQICRAMLWIAFLMASLRYGSLGSLLLTLMFLAVADFFTRQTYQSWPVYSRSERWVSLFAAIIALLGLGLFFLGLIVRSQI